MGANKLFKQIAFLEKNQDIAERVIVELLIIITSWLVKLIEKIMKKSLLELRLKHYED
jgi:hypothetical protein